MFVILLLILILTYTAGSRHDSLLGHEVWSVSTLDVSSDALEVLVKLEEEGSLDILRHAGNRIQFRVFPPTKMFISTYFQQLGLETKVEASDLKTLLDNYDNNERQLGSSRITENETKCSVGSCLAPSSHEYMSFDEIELYLSNIKANYASRVEVESLGKSSEGRDIWLVSIKSLNVTNPLGFFIEGGIHAREWISPAVTLHLIQFILQNPDLTEGIAFNIVPVANPDGYVYAHTRDRFWRKNRSTNQFCRGVDLNRNWGYKWGTGASSSPCSQVYKGETPFSEPETKAIRRAMKKTPNIRIVLAIHSYGQLLLYPWGWTTETAPNTKALKNMGNRMSDSMYRVNKVRYTVANSASGLYFASGTTDDWAKGVLKVKYSFTLELRDKGQYGFLLPANQILDTSNEVWEGVKTAISIIKSEK